MRQIIDISQDWNFGLGELQGSESLVSLPHCARLSPANSSGGRNYQGICTYQKQIAIPHDLGLCRVTIEFGGVMGVTKLFVNNTLAYTHYCGFIPLRADITSFVIAGNNEIRLELDNTDNAEVPPGKPQHSLDFSYEGGAYRTAKITIIDPIHISDELIENEKAGGGIFIHSENITAKSADVFAKIHLRSYKDESAVINVRLILKHENNDIAIASKELTLEKNSAAYVTHEIKVKNPNLWSLELPNLYKAIVQVYENNSLIDEAMVSFGIRDFAFTYNKNFIINGEQKRLCGANYHHTYPYVGNAISGNALRRDARKMRALGIENVRSHYPFADDFTNECDSLGLTLIVSNPGWQWFAEGVFQERLIENIRKIVRWQRNHPSVILWEPMPNESVVPQEVQQLLHNAVHEEYPYSCCFTASDHGPTDVSYRMYDPGMLEPGMEGYNPLRRYGDKSDLPLWIREYNDAPDNWSDQNCAWRTPRSWGDYAQLRAVWRMLGKDSQCSGNNYIDVYNNKMICGYGVWPAMEHNRGYHVSPCWGGYWDMFRLPKLTALFMDSQQDIAKAGCVLHIASWWTDISPEDVTVFSNADSVKLYHDDVLVDEQKPMDISVKHPPFVFKDIHNSFKTRDRSTLRAEAIINGKVAAIQVVKTPGAPINLQLSVDTQGVAVGENDCVIVSCSVTDSDGTIVPYSADNHPIKFEVTGAQIIGNHEIGANPVCPQAGIASIIVRTKATAFTVRARLLWEQSNERVAIQPTQIVVPIENNF